MGLSSVPTASSVPNTNRVAFVKFTDVPGRMVRLDPTAICRSFVTEIEMKNSK